MPYVSQRWLGGMLTNFKTHPPVDQAPDGDRRDVDRAARFDKRGKHEAQMLRREQEKLERSLGGIKNMEGLPDALFVVDVGHEDIAVHEAQKARHPGRRRGRHQLLARRHRAT